MADEIIDEVPYSLDEDFDELTDKDKTVELSGFICSVKAAQEVGRGYKLFKFGLSNGGTKKVQCLIWGQLIDQYEKSIIINRKVHIDGAHCKANSISYVMQAEGYVAYELIIQSTTLLRFYGMHEDVGTIPAVAAPQEVTFETINETQVQGQIIVHGFIKTNFASVPSRYDNATYGCGSITDGRYKLTVHIGNYVPTDLEKGAAVEVIGNVDINSNAPLIVKCKDMSFIRRRVNVPPMSDGELIRGTRAIKRRNPPV